MLEWNFIYFGFSFLCGTNFHDLARCFFYKPYDGDEMGVLEFFKKFIHYDF
jgi:hypothetical protein